MLSRKQLYDLLNRVKRAQLPGGISIETFPDKLDEAKALSKRVKDEENIPENKKGIPIIPLTEANNKMINLGLIPSPSGLEFSYYKSIAENDPNLALAGLRIDIELMLRNLAKGFNVNISKKESVVTIMTKLYENSSITTRQYDLLKLIINLCNSAIHGIRVSKSDAYEVIDTAKVLQDDYIRWLSWGFTEEKDNEIS